MSQGRETEVDDARLTGDKTLDRLPGRELRLWELGPVFQHSLVTWSVAEDVGKRRTNSKSQVNEGTL